jgi:hypothetical protein
MKQTNKKRRRVDVSFCDSKAKHETGRKIDFEESIIELDSIELN